MIESIEFKNFKALRDTTLPLGPCTVIVGPNGSGKSTVLEALEAVRGPKRGEFSRFASFAVRGNREEVASVKLFWSRSPSPMAFGCQWQGNIVAQPSIDFPSGPAADQVKARMQRDVDRIRVYALDARKIAEPSTVQRNIELAGDGTGLAAVLDGMRDEAPDRFNIIESQVAEWLPEFDSVLFDRPSQGVKSVALRTRDGHHKVPAVDLSQGTLIALALLTLAYHPTPPSLVALEEPDRGIHPHLLRHVQDALYRLSPPESCGEKREPVQVIATTHSPYFLELFRENPEDIVIANKVGLDVQFQRLSDQPHIQEYLEDAHLGDIWYTGILGGVPCKS